MEALKFTFYFLGIFAILWELVVVFNPKKVHTFVRKLKRKQETKGVITGSEGLFSILTIIYFIWICVGLFSFQWPVFLTIMLISFIPQNFSSVMRWIVAFLTFILLIFLTLNAYHFKINTYSLLLNFFN